MKKEPFLQAQFPIDSKNFFSRPDLSLSAVKTITQRFKTL